MRLPCAFNTGPSVQYQNEHNAARRDSSDTTASIASTISPPVATIEARMVISTDWDQLNTWV